MTDNSDILKHFQKKKTEPDEMVEKTIRIKRKHWKLLQKTIKMMNSY